VLPLKEAGVDYLALGHIHKNYELEGWIFNPGSIEANSMEESSFARGVYLVDIQKDKIQAELKQDYYQRSLIRLRLTAKGSESVEELKQGAIALMQQAIAQKRVIPAEKPIVELRLEGQVGFDRLELDVKSLQQELQEMSNALIFLLKYDVDTVAYASPLADDANRRQIEQEVFMDMLAAHNTYKKRALELAQGLIELKDWQLEGRSEEELYQFVQSLLISEEA
jgi:DNA repair exonuclease SbcCD nuclease subunit